MSRDSCCQARGTRNQDTARGFDVSTPTDSPLPFPDSGIGGSASTSQAFNLRMAHNKLKAAKNYDKTNGMDNCGLKRRNA